MSLRKLLEEDGLSIEQLKMQSLAARPNMYVKPVIGITRDGVINFARADHVKSPSELEPVPGALEAVALMRSKGYRIILFSNQYGIGERKLTQVDVDVVNQHLLKLLGDAGCPSIDAMYYSTTKLKDDIYALPNIGMFQRAEKETGVRFKDGWFVGDKISDIKGAQNIKAKPVLIMTGEGEETAKKLESFANRDLRTKVKVFQTLLEFAESLE